ncbi:hypothetical protein JTB14_010163 [Gonioctena quinquepunctata]|nr:hypothetical protein JTB14_010163 [Gonioctena quinquepunctata]
MTKLKVAVRVRPMSKKEIDFGSVSVIAVENADTLEITNIKVPEQNAGDSRERVRRFTFDYCFQESCKQDQIFESVEKVISQSVKQRCHSCVLAYGQSSTGKTHTMMGIPEDPGITPKLCNRVFGYLQETAVGDEIINMKVSVSYLEIYNEKVRDLLAPEENHIKRKSSSLKIREHPKRGPYVQDLAGSEKAANRSFDISRFKEGANINKSLVALGNVISALAEQTSKQAKGIRRRFVPYRDSVLTWLLKDILGGNSNTVMVATVSPSSACYSETVNTLRFGQRAKNIISRPVVNEDPKEKTIRVLRAEIFRLKELLSVLQISPQIQMNNTINVATTNANYNHDIENAAKSKESTKEKEVIDELIVTSSEKQEDIGGESKDSLDNIKELNSTEKLVPLINVKSSVDTLRPTKLRRTYSVDHTFKMERKKSISFGSEESIPLNNARSLNSTISSGGDSLNSITGTTRRRQSLSKPTSLPKSTIKRRSLESPPKKMEKAASTELSSWKKIDSKVGSIRQRPVKPRAQIVAGVTSRLYAKMKIKEASTDTNDINTYNLEAVAPKELAICENARTRLREITRKALRAHRYKNEETQTESCQIRRVKEISTDVSDLKLRLTEVKEAGTMSEILQTRDVSIDCSLLDTFNELDGDDNAKCVSFTRSCGTQYSSEEEESRTNSKSLTPMSFTRYLRDAQDDPPHTPIYTHSLNINISNNYINGEKLSNSNSDDSLDNPNGSRSIALATPDLLSNHNSLEHHQTVSKEMVQEISQGSVGDVGYFSLSEAFTPKKFQSFSKATCRTVPNASNLSPSVSMPETYAPEVFLSRMFEEEFCLPFRHFKPPKGLPRVVESEGSECETVIVKEPLVLKSIVKNQSHYAVETDSTVDCRDSLEYHRSNKKVQFSEKSGGESQRMIKAMTSFLEQAKQLMTKMDSSSTPPENDYSVEVTVNDVKGLGGFMKKARKKTSSVQCSKDRNIGATRSEEQQRHEKCVQTLSPVRTHSATQYDFANNMPINRYESVLEDSCRRLEERIRGVPQRRVLHIDDFEDFSLDSHQVESSDYGSLPRRKYSRRMSSSSPSALLRQLTQMRRQIVKSSREDLAGSSGYY